jgi:hypothetical protein
VRVIRYLPRTVDHLERRTQQHEDGERASKADDKVNEKRADGGDGTTTVARGVEQKQEGDDSM